MLYMHHAITFG